MTSSISYKQQVLNFQVPILQFSFKFQFNNFQTLKIKSLKIHCRLQTEN